MRKKNVAEGEALTPPSAIFISVGLFSPIILRVSTTKTIVRLIAAFPRERLILALCTFVGILALWIVRSVAHIASEEALGACEELSICC